MVPVPTGEIDVRLIGWEQLLDGISATPLGQDPSVGASLAIARGFIGQLGEPGDTPDETKLIVTFDGPSVTVNGMPDEPAAVINGGLY